MSKPSTFFDFLIKTARDFFVRHPRLAKLASGPLRVAGRYFLERGSPYQSVKVKFLGGIHPRDESISLAFDTSGLEGRSQLLDPRTVKYALEQAIKSEKILAAARFFLSLVGEQQIASNSHLALVRGLRKRGYLELAQQVIEVESRHKTTLDLAAEKHILWESTKLLTYKGPEIYNHPTAVRNPNSKVVLHVVKNGLPNNQSGYTLRTHKIAKSQIMLGYEVHVACQLGVDGILRTQNKTIEIEGVSYHYFSGPIESTGVEEWANSNVRQLIELSLQLRPVAIHAHSDFVNAWFSEKVSLALGVPWVYEVRGFWEETLMSTLQSTHGWGDLGGLSETFGLPDVYTRRKTREIEMVRSAPAVITLSNSMRQELIARGVPEDKIFISPNAVDSDDFPPSPKSLKLLARLGIPENATVVGYVTSLSHYEGVDDLMKAYQLLEGQVKNKKLALLIVGDGIEYEKLLSLKDNLGTTTMHLVGKVNHASVRDYYSIIDIFVVPRKPYEVCELVPPLKPLEAMALEKCLVVSDVRALRELALESGCIATFQAGNAGSLVEVLSGLILSPAERRAMGQAARKWVESNRTWDANAKLYESLYDRISA